MTEGEYDPYIPHYPGDVITAGDSNEIQVMIREDIDSRIKEAIDDLDKVPAAGNADMLAGKSFGEIKEEIVRAAISQSPERPGFMRAFKRLRLGEESVLAHGLLAWPLVDVYQLDYFRVVASEDGYGYISWVNFFLYHSSERRISHSWKEGGTIERVPIEPPDGHPYRIRFQDMLELYGVEFDDESSLGDVETEFWSKFGDSPNDEMDDDQYAHSPWFDRFWREDRSVGELKRKDDWNELWFQMRPRKTIQFLDESTHRAPTEIQVTHFDFDHLGLTLKNPPALPSEWFDPEDGIEEDRRAVIRNELNVMVLLRV